VNGTREQMIVQNLPLVAFVVGKMSDESGSSPIDREDALAYGIEGLIQAVDGFDDTRGTSFASFAVRRIRGSILDAVRRQDPLPRSLRRSTREIEQAAQQLATQLGRWPNHKEIALRMGKTPRAVQEIQQHAASRFVSLERTMLDGSGGGAPARWDPIDGSERDDPAKAAEQNAALNLLRQAVDGLNERDREILRLRYVESRPFHAVGRVLGLSESRVCQLHKRILRQLRRRLAETLEEAA